MHDTALCAMRNCHDLMEKIDRTRAIKNENQKAGSGPIQSWSVHECSTISRRTMTRRIYLTQKLTMFNCKSYFKIRAVGCKFP